MPLLYLEIKQKQLNPSIKTGVQLNRMEFVDTLITGEAKRNIIKTSLITRQYNNIRPQKIMI
jgi:hypothetical protein